MRVLKHFWACKSQSCFPQWFKWSLFTHFGDLAGTAEPILIWHPSSLSPSLYFSYQSEAQTQLHTSPWLRLLFPNCIVWNIITASKMGLGLSLRDIYFWRPLILFCPHEMSMAWSDAVFGARSSPPCRTGSFFPVSPLGWRDCRCLFWLRPILTMIYLWALVPGLTLASVQPPAWSFKSFPLTLVGMKGTELYLARKARSRDSSGAIFCACSGFF